MQKLFFNKKQVLYTVKIFSYYYYYYYSRGDVNWPEGNFKVLEATISF